MRLLIAVCCLVAIFLAGCGPSEPVDDRAIIEGIADDMEAACGSGDLMKIDKHLSYQAKANGYDANRLLMELTYTDGLKPEFSSRSVRVMNDSAWLEFAVYPSTVSYSDILQKSKIRLMRSGGWKIATYDIYKNEIMRAVPVDSMVVDSSEGP